MVITGREGQTKSTRNIIKRMGEGVEVGGGGGGGICWSQVVLKLKKFLHHFIDILVLCKLLHHMDLFQTKMEGIMQVITSQIVFQINTFNF